MNKEGNSFSTVKEQLLDIQLRIRLASALEIRTVLKS
jgi:hypothetical protein